MIHSSRRAWKNTPGTAPLPECRARASGPPERARWGAGTKCLAACATALFLTALPHTHAQAQAQAQDRVVAEASPTLEEIERERRELKARGDELKHEAEKLEQEAVATQRRMVEIAAEARKREAAISELETRLADIHAEEKLRMAGLKARRTRLKELLAALERIARHPPEAMMAYTRTPQDTLRGAILLRAAIPKLEAQARELKESLQALAELREQASARADALARERAALTEKRQELAALVAKKKTLARSTEKELEAAARRQAQLARKARDLRELLQNIERERERQAAASAARAARRAARDAEHARRQQAAQEPREAEERRQARLVLRPPATRNLPSSIARARGQLIPPVLGRVAVQYGEKSGLATTAKGASFETADGAQVVAPFGGEVVFSGPFRGYGLLLIIDHGEGYHSLLAGLGRVDAPVGQRLLAGEPVGVMARTAGDLPRLYMELRQSSRPIDPLPWLAAPPTTEAKSKVSG